MVIFNTYLQLCVSLFFVIQVILTSSEIERISCKIDLSKNNSVNFRFECLIEVEFNRSEGIVNCTELSANSLRVQIYSDLLYSSFVCTSNFPIFPDVQFSKDFVHKSYLNIRPKRIVADINDPSTYVYQLHIYPHSRALTITNDICSTTKYTLLSVTYPAEKIFVLWENNGNSTADSGNVCWMDKLERATDPAAIQRFDSFIKGMYIDTFTLNQVVVAKEDVVVIPCIHFDQERLVLESNNKKLDYEIISYNSLAGFTLNVSKLDLNDTFCCRISISGTAIFTATRLFFSLKQQQEDVLSFSFEISNSHPASFPVTPPYFQYIGQHYNGAMMINDYQGAQFIMKCYSKKYNVKICRHSCPHRVSLSPQNESVAHLYMDEYITPYLGSNKKIILVCKAVVNDPRIDEFAININIDKNRYELKGIDASVKYEQEEKIITCIRAVRPVLKQIACENIFMCRQLASSLQRESINGISFGSECADFINSKVKIQVETHNKMKYRERIHCRAMKPLSKGLLECSETPHDVFQQFYFHGLNGQFYLGLTNISVDAILKITTDFKGSLFPIPEKYSFSCEAHSFFFEDGLLWFWTFTNGTTTLIPNANKTDEGFGDKQSADFNPLRKTKLSFGDVTIVGISCSAPVLSMMDVKIYGQWKTASINITTAHAVPATIVNPETEVAIRLGEKEKGIKCETSGFPTPNISWMKVGNELDSSINIFDKIFQKTLQFPIYNESHAGEYICFVENYIGNATAKFIVTTESENLVRNLAIVLPVVASLLLCLFVTITYWIYKKAKISRSAEFEELLELLNGNSKDIATGETAKDCTPEENPYKQSYDETFEMDRHSFQINQDKILGKGEYGIVFKGRISKIDNEVAIKTTNCAKSIIQLKSLVSELKAFIYIGKHENIVELLGAYTKEIKSGVLFVAFELCGLGDLKSYLMSNRGRFAQCPGLQSFSQPDYMNTKVESSTVQEISNINSLTALLKWACGIASGMEHLASIRVVHSDLAARNVLLTVDFVVKITDFGLSRRTYYSTEYLKKGQDPLPWRGLAIESLKMSTFSEKSDVWAYGILLWEMFTLGETPYPGLSPTTEFVSNLENGMRNLKPKYASSKLYDLMIKCWHSDPQQRPTFTGLKFVFKNAITCGKQDIDLMVLQEIPTMPVEYINLDGEIA